MLVIATLSNEHNPMILLFVIILILVESEDADFRIYTEAFSFSCCFGVGLGAITMFCQQTKKVRRGCLKIYFKFGSC